MREDDKPLVSNEKMQEVLSACYDKALEGIPTVSPSLEQFVNDYVERNDDAESAAKEMVKYQIMKCTTSGFVTGFGGLITLPISVPANLASVLYVQMRMIAGVAAIAGYDPRSDQVQSMVYACLVGKSMTDLFKQCGVDFGKKMAELAIGKIPGSVCSKINRAVGFRLITKFGETGVINLGKAIPVVGAAVNASFDLATTKVIADNALKVFIGSNGLYVDEINAAQSKMKEVGDGVASAVQQVGAAAVSAGEQAGKALTDGAAAVGDVVGKGAQAAGGVLEEGAKAAGGAVEGGLHIAGKGLGDAAKGIGGFFGSIGKR